MTTTTIHDILEEFRAAATSNRDLGDKFERLIATYLLTDPQYSDRLSDVWLWQEWPGRGKKVDTGIDLVARERGTGDHWAIQCKFYDPAHSIQKADIDSFFTASGQKHAANDQSVTFTQRLIFSTTSKWSKHAEDALEDQSIPTFRISAQDLADSPVDWSQFSLANVTDLKLRKKKDLRQHQAEALGLVREGFTIGDRGKLIMACGTGKTFTALKVAEATTPPNGTILFLAPSISLVSQTLREWTAESSAPMHAFVVCSDSKVGKENEDIRTHDLAYPATTDPKRLAAATQAVSHDRRTVIFSTYQSIQVAADAQKLGLAEFDLIICDEAHRTTGVSLEDEEASDFLKVHAQNIIRGKKRLYMTATPRIYADASKNKAENSSAALYSMDDEDLFGPEFYRLGFGKAVDKDLLSEYKVLIVAVDEDQMAGLTNQYNAFKIDGKKAIDTKFATKIIGSWKGLSKQGLVLVGEDGEQEAVTEDTAPMRRAVAFSRSIQDSKTTTNIFKELVELYTEAHNGDAGGMVHCDLDHVDGSMNSLIRLKALDWLKAPAGENECRILSNARCLSEGIDVPALDSVIFFDTRESIVDIVQSVGRVMRKAEGKKYGYIILPVGIPSSKVKDYNSYIESDGQFKGIWKVIKALRAHDESLVDEAEFRRKIKIIGAGNGGKNGDKRDGSSLPLDFPALSIDGIADAVYAAIPKKLGDREYWSEWAKSIGQIAERLNARIRALLAADDVMASDFATFLKGLQDTLNPAVSEAEAIEMLAQHILTLPVFQALFSGSQFPDNNVVANSLQKIVAKLDASAVDSEIEGLEKFYVNVRERISLAKSDKSKQDIIRNLYDTFFNNAFPRMAERLGIVYTPVEVVDFILKSADVALRKHFGESLASHGVQILDPFAGTGTFLVRLIQSGLIDAADLPHKFEHEMHANEIVLLAYYIATVNLETAFHAQTGTYRPFNGMVLTDTFQMTEESDLVDRVVLPENNAKAEHQLAQPIRVIVGNPPYSAQQDSQNDNNQNLAYPTLDARIRDTYAAKSGAANKKNLYDSYIRAIRWSSDRIGERGIVAFVTNGSFLDHNNMDGLRKCLPEDFSHLYLFNLRGFIRGKSKELSQLEGGNVFDILTGVAITVLVKDPSHVGLCELHYHDIGDYLSREEKLEIIEGFGSIATIDWQRLHPNDSGDWINQRDPAFDKFVPLTTANNENGLFEIWSNGLLSARDAWVYSFSKSALSSNMAGMSAIYNVEVDRYAALCKGKTKDQWPDPAKIVDQDPKKISWTSSLLPNVARGRKANFDQSRIVASMYRPFSKCHCYYDNLMNHRVAQWPKLMPTPKHQNVVISSIGVADRKGFSVFIADQVPDYHLTDTGRCFPLYWYEKIEKEDKTKPGHTAGLFAEPKATPDEHGYVRHDAITDWALGEFRKRYADAKITKEDIFYYVYGILHSPEYKQRFASDLKKMLPRIPFAKDFRAFSKAGRDLAVLHLNYETIEPFPLVESTKRLVMEPGDYRVSKMVFGKKDGKPDNSVIVYNNHITLSGIPPEAYDYVVNGKPALEWIKERYEVTKDKDSGIENDPNAWSDDPRYIIDLIKRVTQVSIKSAALVASLPALNEFTSSKEIFRAERDVECVLK